VNSRIVEKHVNTVLLPSRLVLEAVAVLHRRGCERLRIQPAMSPSGAFWRVKLGPADWFRPDHGAMLLTECRSGAPLYSSAMGHNYFQWTDCGQDSASELALKMKTRFGDVIRAAYGADHAYAEWYRQMLETTAPQGLIYAFADWGIPNDGLHSIGTAANIVVPFPPLITPVERSLIGE